MCRNIFSFFLLLIILSSGQVIHERCSTPEDSDSGECTCKYDQDLKAVPSKCPSYLFRECVQQQNGKKVAEYISGYYDYYTNYYSDYEECKCTEDNIQYYNYNAFYYSSLRCIPNEFLFCNSYSPSSQKYFYSPLLGACYCLNGEIVISNEEISQCKPNSGEDIGTELKGSEREKLLFCLELAIAGIEVSLLDDLLLEPPALTLQDFLKLRRYQVDEKLNKIIALLFSNLLENELNDRKLISDIESDEYLAKLEMAIQYADALNFTELQSSNILRVLQSYQKDEVFSLSYCKIINIVKTTKREAMFGTISSNCFTSTILYHNQIIVYSFDEGEPTQCEVEILFYSSSKNAHCNPLCVESRDTYLKCLCSTDENGYLETSITSDEGTSQFGDISDDTEIDILMVVFFVVLGCFVLFAVVCGVIVLRMSRSNLNPSKSVVISPQAPQRYIEPSSSNSELNEFDKKKSSSSLSTQSISSYSSQSSQSSKSSQSSQTSRSSLPSSLSPQSSSSSSRSIQSSSVSSISH